MAQKLIDVKLASLGSFVLGDFLAINLAQLRQESRNDQSVVVLGTTGVVAQPEYLEVLKRRQVLEFGQIVDLVLAKVEFLDLQAV